MPHKLRGVEKVSLIEFPWQKKLADEDKIFIC